MAGTGNSYQQPQVPPRTVQVEESQVSEACHTQCKSSVHKKKNEQVNTKGNNASTTTQSMRYK